MTNAADESNDVPVITIERGNPTPEEIAALVLVLAAASGSGAAQEPKPAASWADHRWAMRHGFHHGRGAWRLSRRR